MAIVTKAPSAFVRVIDKIEQIWMVVAGVFSIVMVLITTYGVILRYVFRAPTSLGQELGALCLVPVSVLTLSYVQKHKGHIAMEVVVSKLSPKTQDVLQFIVWLLFLAYAAFITFAGGQLAVEHVQNFQTTFYSGIPLIIFSGMMPLGLGLLALRVVIDAVHTINVMRGKAPRPERVVG